MPITCVAGLGMVLFGALSRLTAIPGLTVLFLQSSQIPRAKGDRNEGKYGRWRKSRAGDEGSQAQPPSQPRTPRTPRPRTNIPPPRTISMNPSGSLSPAPPPPEPPPESQSNPFASALYKTISAFPGFRDITNDPMENWFEDNPRRRSPAYGDWAADIEVGDDWDYRPGGSDFKYQADTRARYANTNTPRDSFMRPIADPIGVADRCCCCCCCSMPCVLDEHSIMLQPCAGTPTNDTRCLLLTPQRRQWSLHAALAT